MVRNPWDIPIKPIRVAELSSFKKKPKRSLGVRDRQILYRRAQKKCEACKKKLDYDEMQVGHRRAYSKGGATTLANSACLCYKCNKHQGTGSLEALKKKLKGTYGKRTSKKKRSKKSRAKKGRKSVNPFAIQPLRIPKLGF